MQGSKLAKSTHYVANKMRLKITCAHTVKQLTNKKGRVV